MTYSDLIVNKEDHVCKVIINREKNRNAISPNTWEELNRLIDDIENDPSIRVVIIRGAGNRTFAAGADLKEMKKRTPTDMVNSLGSDVLLKIEKSRAVWIAAINGFALGGGCELALACDIRIAAKNAKFGQPEVNLSLIPAAGGTQRLPRIVGVGYATDMILSGKIIDAEEALRIGLITELCDYEELDEKAMEKAKQILTKGPLAVQFAKKIINSKFSGEVQGYMLEKLYQAYLFTTEDMREGVNAFLEKREPEYRGK